MDEQLASHRTSKLFVVYMVVVLLGIAAVWVLYECFAHQLVTAMYEGRSIRALNRLIQYQHKHSLDHYLELADTIFYRALFLFSAGLGLVHILHRLIFSGKKIKAIWPILWGVFVLTGIYALNPDNRVYSIHGFFRAGIVYQILNGHVPPLDPLFAGETVRAPWGFLWLTAQLTRILNITPFYCFAIINVVSLGVCLILLYEMSRLLIKDGKANVFSAVISIFGMTIFNSKVVVLLQSVFPSFQPELRIIPVFKKFSNINGIPIGLVFFLLFVYAIIKILENKNTWFYAILTLVSILGCGFFYLPMAPGIPATTLALTALWLMLARTNYFAGTAKPVILTIGAVIIGTLLLGPYVLSASSGVSQSIELFNFSFVLENCANYLIAAGPLLIITLINIKYLVNRLNSQVFLVLLVVMIGNAACYLFIHLPDSAEYKFLLLSTVTLGILAGLALHNMKRWCHKTIVLILMLLFLFPSYEVTLRKLKKHGHKPVYIENGKNLLFAAEEENELYQWIKLNTPKNSVFIDLELKIPVYAQRRLFTGMDRRDGKKEIGYGLYIDDILRIRNGIDPHMIAKRKTLVENIYGLDDTLPRKEILDYLAAEDIYVIVRTETLGTDFEQEGFEEVFSSSQKHFIVYKSHGSKF